ncbi:hypothetical protein M404DRAFT_29500 [Pisolithus tinctorius Marx 270]|uniref:Uncharacterized protein n=1 Tax=Pisolithus tinctorius Marx 270 TaxID=870435 RepID=A0A0C3IUM2_PISTI|nr:hypothetical protein M404DRAFT_29500 [Pisolithus tinctorius Marx 270]
MNKQKPAKQLAKQERRHTHIRHQLDAAGESSTKLEETAALSKFHHHLSDSLSNAINLAAFLSQNSEDPAVKDFIPKLKDHLLS